MLGRCHDAITSAQVRFAITLARVRVSYYWLDVRLFVIKYIAECHTCLSKEQSIFGPIRHMDKEKHISFRLQAIARFNGVSTYMVDWSSVYPRH